MQVGFYIRLEYFWGQELWLLVVDNALPHVLLQRARHAERHGTEATLERVVAGPAVGLHVPRQLATLGTGVWAQLTLVGLLPGMRSPMDCQVAAVLEHFPAVLARVVLALPDYLLARLRIEDGVDAPLLDQGPQGARLHGIRQLKTRRQQGQIFQQRESSSVAVGRLSPLLLLLLLGRSVLAVAFIVLTNVAGFNRKEWLA